MKQYSLAKPGKFVDLVRSGQTITAIDDKPIVFPKGSGIINHVCCQCGLSHDIKVEIKDHRLTLTFLRHDKSELADKAKNGLNKEGV